MITEPTVFILGAGASAPYGFPTGYQLKCNICRPEFQNKIQGVLLRRDKITQKEVDNTLYELKEFQKKFSNSSTPSIDLFISRNPDFAEIGKKCILIEILNSEYTSSFGLDLSTQDQNWYSYIYERMAETLFHPGGYKEFCNNKVSFITFNYDRSLEFFLQTSLKNSFVINEDECSLSSVLAKLNILHVYGQIGPLEWQIGGEEQNKVIPYRATASYRILDEYTSNIFTIYDERQTLENDSAIEIISNAKHVFFLGFGYAPENLKALGIPQTLKSDKRIYGTAFGLKNGEIERIKNLLHPGTGLNDPYIRNEYKIENFGCKDLLREHINYS